MIYIAHCFDHVILNNYDRIAQLIVTPYASPVIREVSSLEDTDRGEGGFGSTGISTSP